MIGNRKAKIVMIAMFANEASVLRRMLDSTLGHCDYYTATIPTICIENKVNESEILQVLRKNHIGILWSHHIGQYIYWISCISFGWNKSQNNC